MVMRYFSRDTDIITKRRDFVRCLRIAGHKTLGWHSIRALHDLELGPAGGYTDNTFADHGGIYTTCDRDISTTRGPSQDIMGLIRLRGLCGGFTGREGACDGYRMAELSERVRGSAAL